MILSGPGIIVARDQGLVIINPFDPSRIGPNSYDLTLDRKILTYKRNYIDPKIDNEVEEHIIKDDGMILRPGILYLGNTIEVAGSNSLVPCLEGKSSLARLGIQIHMTAGFGDDGFVGKWTLEIMVAMSTRIYYGMKIAQVYFYEMVGARKPYSGKYQDSQDVVPSRSFVDFK